MGTMVEIESLDGAERFPAYRADPAGTPRAAILVVQEIFGLNPGIRQKVDDWAALGYLAVAPDLFWRFAPGVQLDPDVASERDEALGYIKRYDLDHGVADIEATIRWARRAIGGSAPKVGVVGFCLGGRLAYLSATRTDADAAVGYYGGGIDQMLGEGHAIGRPLILHFGDEDTHITPEIVAAVRDALSPNPHITIHQYPHAGHGFATTRGQRRQPGAAEAADARTQSFFADTLV